MFYTNYKNIQTICNYKLITIIYIIYIYIRCSIQTIKIYKL